MSTTLLDLLEQPPAGGTPVGLDDWMFSVELGIPLPESALYDFAIYDTDRYSDNVAWRDLTGWVRGVEWTRGADEPGGAPRTGVATITLDNRSGEWTPWDFEDAAAYRRPGTLIRFATYTPDGDWLPQFGGIVESWEEETDGLGHERIVTVTLMETVGLLAWTTAQTVAPVGAAETASARWTRLLNTPSGVWPYGFFEEYVSGTTMQATTMQQNRLAELNVTADSIDGYFRSHRSGKAMVEAAHPPLIPGYLGPTVSRYDATAAKYDDSVTVYAASPGADSTTMRPATFYFAGVVLRPDVAGYSTPDHNGQVVASFVYDGDSMVTANDADALANDVRLTRNGGVQQVREDLPSIGKYGRRTLSRASLINDDDTTVATIATRILSRRSNMVLRVVSVDLWCRPDNLKGIMVLDLMDAVTVVLPDNQLAVKGNITSVEHSVSARTASALLWTCRLGLTTYPGLVARQHADITAVATVTVVDVAHPERLALADIAATVEVVAVPSIQRLELAAAVADVAVVVEYAYRYETCLTEGAATVTVSDVHTVA
jgi:hypothetical protein